MSVFCMPGRVRAVPVVVLIGGVIGQNVLVEGLVPGVVVGGGHPKHRGYRTLGVAGGVTFWLSGAGKSVF